jgi:hypothetical protein
MSDETKTETHCDIPSYHERDTVLTPKRRISVTSSLNEIFTNQGRKKQGIYKKGGGDGGPNSAKCHPILQQLRRVVNVIKAPRNYA